MFPLFRWLLRIATALVVLSVVVVVGVYYFLSRSLPDYDATWTVRGVSGPVEIARNTWAVPHIFAEADADVFYGLGFAHAQDRLWQMTLMRRTVQGRLSELFGERTLRTDELMRRLDLYGLAQQSVGAQDNDTLSALDAYARGVNAWINLVNERALGRGAPEYFLFPGEVGLWQPADSIAMIKLMAVQLSGHLEAEVRHARLSALIGEERTRDLMSRGRLPSGLAALPDFASLFPTLTDTQLAMAHGARTMRRARVSCRRSTAGKWRARRTSGPPRRCARRTAGRCWPMIHTWPFRRRRSGIWRGST